MATTKSFWKCWVDSNEEDIDEIKLQFLETKTKLDEAQKIISRLKFDKLALMNSTNISNLGDSINPTVDEQSLNIHDSRLKPNLSNIAFDYSTSTMIVHNENTNKQTSALEKLEEKVMEKYNAKTEIKYELLSDSYDEDNIFSEEEEDIELLKQKHKQQINELMKQIDKLSNIIQKTEKNKNIIIENKNKQITLLKKQIYQLKTNTNINQMQTESKPGIMTKSDSFSMSVNKEIKDINTGMDSEDSDTIQSPVKKYNKQKNHYDNTKEQIEILNDEILKYKSLDLCNEKLNINNKNNNEKGIILFFEKYLKSKTIEQIFKKSGKSMGNNGESITNATGLVNVLSFVIILYKVKIFHVKYGKNKNPKINNSDIKNMVKYLAIWIVRTYGEKSDNKYFYNKTKQEYDVYNFKLTKQDFEKYMYKYLQEFVENKGKHIDSQL